MQKTRLALTAFLLAQLSLNLPLAPAYLPGTNTGEALAFNLLKKKGETGGQAGGESTEAKEEKEAKDPKAGKDGKEVKEGKVTKDAKSDEPKEKVKGMSKEDIKEEEELTAEFEAYQSELKASLKAVRTPFGTGDSTAKTADDGLHALSLQNGNQAAANSPVRTAHLSLRDRLFQTKVYMPGRMVIGRPAEFTVKGRPGYWAAVAMADKDKGAKPIYGHELRLGPDRKVVALGKIPASGVLSLKVFAPVAGDLVGGNLYFEAAVWPENNPAALELAQPLSSETQAASTANSVTMVGQGERKHGLQFVPDNSSPYAHVNTPGLSSGRP